MYINRIDLYVFFVFFLVLVHLHSRLPENRDTTDAPVKGINLIKQMNAYYFLDRASHHRRQRVGLLRMRTKELFFFVCFVNYNLYGQ